MRTSALKFIGISESGAHVFDYGDEVVIWRNRLQGEILPDKRPASMNVHLKIIVLSPDTGEVIGAYSHRVDFEGHLVEAEFIALQCN